MPAHDEPVACRCEAFVLASDSAALATEIRPIVEQLLDVAMTAVIATHAEAGTWHELALTPERARRFWLVDAEQQPLDGVIRELWQRGIDRNQIAVLADTEGAIPPGVVSFDGTSRTIVAFLEDQLTRRRARELPGPGAAPWWRLEIDELDDGRERVRDALVTLADGRIGLGGTLLGFDATSPPRMIAAGVYDGDGPATHLLLGPVMAPLRGNIADRTRLRRVLDLHAGLLYEELDAETNRTACVRFVSMARPATAAARLLHSSTLAADGTLLAPAGARPLDEATLPDGSWMRITGSSGGIVAATAYERIVYDTQAVLDGFVTYSTDPEPMPDAASAIAAARESKADGFDRLLAEHREAWARRWEDADIAIEGDDELQLATRFALYQLMASVCDGPEAAVGARGLSGLGYRGHVFWDADTFVLPFFAATHPASARAMLEYRIHRLATAREVAMQLNRRGARFPWESARSGRDVTPPSARDRWGKVVPIRTGLLEEHIVADVAWAACTYVDWTGDEQFANGPLLTLLVDTARYWASRIRVEADGAHIYGVIGPDEYHEPVDDNAFTNVMARWNLRRAVAALAAAPASRHGVSTDERHTWRELADSLADGYDADTGVYEQFAGFKALEPLIIEDVAPRRPIAADVLLGAERVRRAQIVKQADVVMLHHLVPDEVMPGSLGPNLRYYEPRTAHGSSLSPAIHASLFARVGDFARALEVLGIASRVDLEDLTGTTAGGLHVATMGGLWQALVFGFGGVRPQGGRLEIDPSLPPDWSALETRVRFRGSRVSIRAEHERLTVRAEPPTRVTVEKTPFDAGPDGLTFSRQDGSWNVTP